MLNIKAILCEVIFVVISYRLGSDILLMLQAITINANAWIDAGHAVNQIYDILYMMDRDDVSVGVGGEGGILEDGTILADVGGYLPIIEQVHKITLPLSIKFVFSVHKSAFYYLIFKVFQALKFFVTYKTFDTRAPRRPDIADTGKLYQ